MRLRTRVTLVSAALMAVARMAAPCLICRVVPRDCTVVVKLPT